VLHQRWAGAEPANVVEARCNKESAAVFGFCGAIGAYGGFFVPKSYGVSIAATGGVTSALLCFVGFYVTCLLINWWYYDRAGAEAPC
jgi:NNP family nitrate/nitrite transporter-like MFS transporter